MLITVRTNSVARWKTLKAAELKINVYNADPTIHTYPRYMRLGLYIMTSVMGTASK